MDQISKSSIYGMLYGASFLFPILERFHFVSFLLRISIASAGIIGIASVLRDQYFKNFALKSSFVCGLCFGACFIIVSLFGIYKAFYIVNQKMFFVPCLLFLAFVWGGMFGWICIMQSVLLEKITNTKKKLSTFADYALSNNIKKNNLERIPFFSLSFVICWLLFELSRSFLLFKFPWNLTSHLFCFENTYPSLLFAQIVKPGGIYFLSVVWNLFVVSIFCEKSKSLKIISTFIISTVIIYGLARLYSDHQPIGNPIPILIVQPNISQEIRLKKEHTGPVLQQMIRLTLQGIQASSIKPKIIIWPETAVTQMIREDDISVISQIQNQTKNCTYKYIIFGADRVRNCEKHPVWHNSMIVLSKQKVEQIYDKNVLLPFGEYIPWRCLFPTFFNKILGSIDCTPGERVDNVILDKIPSFIPQICSEFMHKKRIIPAKAKWVLQILNDGWFATSILRQHLAVDRLRAIEAGLPLVRVANTGISCVMTRRGVITEQINLNHQAVRCVSLRIA